MKKNSKTIHYSAIPITCCIGMIFAFVFLLIFGVFKINNVALILLIPIFALFSLLFKGFFRLLFSFLLGVSLGYIRGQAYYLGISSASLPQKQEVTIEAKVDSDPAVKNGTLRFESSNLKLNNTTINCPAYFSLVPSDINISKTDLVLVKGKNSGAFGKYCAFFNKPEVHIISKPDPPDLFIEFRDWFSMRLIEIIDGKDSGASEMSALGLGYLTGQKRYISEDFNESLRRAGLSHIVVASGFHLAIVAGLARKYFYKVSRFATLLGAGLLIFAFVSITGLTASMFRAAFLTLISLLAWYFGRKMYPMRAILYIAALSLLINPGYISDLAWQLSFSSYLGIIFLAPLLLDYFYGKDSPSFIASTCIQSISAQLLCLPISIYNFGAFSIVSLFSNLLIPPTIPIAMLLSLLSVFFSWIPIISQALAFFTKVILGLHVYIIETLSKISWGSTEAESGNQKVFLLYLVPLVVFLILRLITKHSFHPYRPAKLASTQLEKS
jgi:competence protein ComEC